jgi:hypothetical protein
MSVTATAGIAELELERDVLAKELERVEAELSALLGAATVDTHSVARLCEEKCVYRERLSEVTREESRLLGDQWVG